MVSLALRSRLLLVPFEQDDIAETSHATSTYQCVAQRHVSCWAVTAGGLITITSGLHPKAA
jgi:hypothetical protein